MASSKTEMMTKTCLPTSIIVEITEKQEITRSGYLLLSGR